MSEVADPSWSRMTGHGTITGKMEGRFFAGTFEHLRYRDSRAVFALYSLMGVPLLTLEADTLECRITTAGNITTLPVDSQVTLPFLSIPVTIDHLIRILSGCPALVLEGFRGEVAGNRGEPALRTRKRGLFIKKTDLVLTIDQPASLEIIFSRPRNGHYRVIEGHISDNSRFKMVYETLKLR